MLLGGALSIYILYCHITYDISAVAENGHIRYYRDFPYINIIRPVYFVTVVITPFLSTLRYTKLFAGAMFASVIVSFLFYRDYLISVWCFFAAILSLLMILVINSNRRTASTIVEEEKG